MDWRDVSTQVLALPLLMSLAIGAFELTSPHIAHAQVASIETSSEAKAHWQESYRKLRREAARLRQLVDRETTAYAEANRRNYRRGTVRHVHRKAALEAQQELAVVEAKLARFSDDAIKQGALPGWLYEVEDEPVEIPDGNLDPDASDAEDDTAGRNPIYLDDDDDN